MTSQFKCPVCKKDLEYEVGHAINPKDGVTIFCPHRECSMQDWGHAKDEKGAFAIFKLKCGKE